MEQPQERIDFKYIRKSIFKVLNFEKGLPLTLWELLFHPSKMVFAYLDGTRKKYTNPIQYSVLLVGIWAVLFNLIQKDSLSDFLGELQDGIEKEEKNITKKALPEDIEQYFAEGVNMFSEYQNVLNLALIPVLALLTYLFYRRFQLYYAEHLVVNAYIVGTVSAIGIFFIPLAYFHAGLAFLMGAFFGSSYMIWVYMDVFQGKSIKGFFKSLSVNIIYYCIAFSLITISAIAYILFLFIKTGTI